MPMPLTPADKLDILELAARYNHAIDHGHAEAWAATFTDDGVFQVDKVPRAQGRDALLAHVRKRVIDGRSVRHWTSNAIIDGDDQNAHAQHARLRLYVAIYDTAHALGAPFLLGEYDDRLVKQDGQWKFALRDLTTVAGKAAAPPVGA